MTYEKHSDRYNYVLFTNVFEYEYKAHKANFKEETDATRFIPCYSLTVTDRLMAIRPLNIIKGEGYRYEMLDAAIEDGIGLEFEFQNDERTRNNPSVKRLKVNIGDIVDIVALKLCECREKGIDAFAIFNGVELNNFGITNYYQIIDAYEQELKHQQSYNQSLNENQQLTSENRGIKR